MERIVFIIPAVVYMTQTISTIVDTEELLKQY